jgi:Tol biopolymer transport system component
VDSDPKSDYRIVARDLKTRDEKELHRGAGQVRSLTLAPDGRQLAFSEEDAATGSRVIKAMPAAGGATHELCRMRIKPSGSYGFGINMVRWTPDGRQLLFGWLTQGTTELWRVPTAGGEPQRLGVTMAHASHLSVHPDGQQISFHAAISDGGAGVWVMESFLPAAQTATASAPRR